MTSPYYPFDDLTPPYDPYQRTYYGGLEEFKEDDITQGFTVYLLDQPEILNLVGIEPGTGVEFIFQERYLKNLKGTSSNAITVTYMGDWASPSRSTFEGARMAIRIYCDPMRDEGGNATPGADRETRTRLMKIYRTVKDNLDHLYGEVWMGDVKTIDHTRLGSITIAPEPEGDGMLRGEVFYGVSILSYGPRPVPPVVPPVVVPPVPPVTP